MKCSECDKRTSRVSGLCYECEQAVHNKLNRRGGGNFLKGSNAKGNGQAVKKTGGYGSKDILPSRLTRKKK